MSIPFPPSPCTCLKHPQDHMQAAASHTAQIVSPALPGVLPGGVGSMQGCTSRQEPRPSA